MNEQNGSSSLQELNLAALEDVSGCGFWHDVGYAVGVGVGNVKNMAEEMMTQAVDGITGIYSP